MNQSADSSTGKLPVAKVSAGVNPEGSLEVLSQLEVNALLDTSARGLYGQFRRCALAVLNTGSPTDDACEIFETYKDFGINLKQRNMGIRLRLENAPSSAFVDGEMIRGIREHLFAVLRDIIYVHNLVHAEPGYDLGKSSHITSAVFHILRNAGVLHAGAKPNLVVCWGGHSIPRHEYDYSKEVGYQLGLRELDVCTGCGPGAMKGPMKGATIGHAKQRVKAGRYIGISEPGIIAAEAPNPIVNSLVIMPDIEKRLEAFVRCGHAVVIFPGGVGTAEEMLYLLGILMHPNNQGHPFPLVFTGPGASTEYFHAIDQFVVAALGNEVRRHYRVIIDDPSAVARYLRQAMREVQEFRDAGNDAFYFDWRLKVEQDLQMPFVPTHETMASLELSSDLDPHLRAANLRRAFSGIVAGNVKEDGIRMVEALGPFEIRGEPKVVQAMERLLRGFVAQNRMKLRGAYTPCYRLVG
jgi:predicted Rossmann-fold nucleotide-binding protein